MSLRSQSWARACTWQDSVRKCHQYECLDVCTLVYHRLIGRRPSKSEFLSFSIEAFRWKLDKMTWVFSRGDKIQ